ncbi:alkaline phosphatase family protein [Streptomyces sp. 3MP-14]|uniref:Alkaline phosphatase family protein n=1 Tax=Streptomyces mimosae TaxID=2586635 RepID=A0A5N6AJZ7_9ACTN|nr:alkaline phosphatase family protein [Streptomyces mimosae]KAB8177678.1 alkaline phosphatase family protein [Streptomyces sp. 3MP-14]
MRRPQLRGRPRLHGLHHGRRPVAAGERGRRRPGDGAAGAGVRAGALRGDRGVRQVIPRPDGGQASSSPPGDWPEPPSPLDPRQAPAPRYGTGSLADVLPAVLAGLDVPGGRPDFALPPADRVCVFLVDGLGWEQLHAHAELAPFLSSLLPTSRAGAGAPITVGFPSTTATSLASLGTGLPPGAHGLAGYRVLDPGSGALMNQLRWEPWTDPGRWQPHPTLFRRADAAGVATCQVSAPHFERTPLTRVALSGGAFLGRSHVEERIDVAARRLGEAGRTLVYTYYAELDAAGHRFGVDSDAWREQLALVDGLARRLAEQLPSRAALYVTGDHGMIDVPVTEEARFDFDHDWELRAGVAQLGGEGRARHLYAVPGAASDVHAVWREVLAEDAWVVTRDEAVELGWFGPPGEEVAARVRPRIGDVVVAMTGVAAVIASESEPRESALIGMHGSLTPAEQLVPLLEVRT